tara:strand:+ start:287 stop:841 length:555 start_codon:yes stop_codon:yes gene_type:complete
MGIFDFFKRKTQEEKNVIVLEKLRKQTIAHEPKSLMHDMIISDEHDNSYLDENPTGKGKFGFESSNPIPIYGMDNIPAYFDKLRYAYTSESGKTIYNHVDFERTTDIDESSIGSKKPTTALVASSTSAPNIKGYIDVYNLYSIGGEKLAKIYLNCYSLKTSNKIPDGFFHRDKVPSPVNAKDHS